MIKNFMLDIMKIDYIDLNSIVVKIRYASIWKLMVDLELLIVVVII